MTINLKIEIGSSTSVVLYQPDQTKSNSTPSEIDVHTSPRMETRFNLKINPLLSQQAALKDTKRRQ